VCIKSQAFRHLHRPTSGVAEALEEPGDIGGEHGRFFAGGEVHASGAA
jgi:hypothetical protein